MIFSQRDNAEMRKAANFLWVDEDYFLTWGITTSDGGLLDVDCKYLNRVIDNIIERRKDGTA